MSVFSLILLCIFNIQAFAHEPTEVNIEIEVEGGGTVDIISEVNCPIPEVSEIKVPNGLTERIKISFTEVGIYTYTIKVAEKKDVYYSPEYYTAKIMVSENDENVLSTRTVLTNENGDVKFESAKFNASSHPIVKPDDPSSKPDRPDSNPDQQQTEPDQPGQSTPGSQPYTGDDSAMDLYLVLAIAASAGIFIISLIYTFSTNKLINGARIN